MGSYCIFVSFGHRIHRVENILSVAIDYLQILESGKVGRHLTVGRLVFLWHRNTITIVLYYKYDRELLLAGTVDSLVYIPFGGRSLTVGSNHHSFVTVI